MPTDLKGYWEKAAKRQQSRDILISSPKLQMQHPKALAKPKVKDSSSKHHVQNAENLHKRTVTNMFLVKTLSTFLHPQLKNSGRKRSSTSVNALYFCPSWILDNQSRYLFFKSFCKTVSIQEDNGVLARQLTGSQRAQWVQGKTYQAILEPHTPATPLPMLFSSKHIWKQLACGHVDRTITFSNKIWKGTRETPILKAEQIT